jgi:RimJ/RimL family protein N-acetyltransferase
MDSLLRCVRKDDLPIFFEHQLDREAIYMAAFTAKDSTDRVAFMAHWERILAESAIISRTIVVDDQVAGHVMSYEEDGHPEVTYWLGREYWGKGLATRALSEFLLHGNQIRPIYARAAKDNAASIRVLEKCGFAIVGESRGFANGRGAEIEEWLLQL